VDALNERYEAGSRPTTVKPDSKSARLSFLAVVHGGGALVA